MLLVRGNTDIIRVVTGSSADIEPFISAMQADAASPPVISIPNLGPAASITTATTTTVVDGAALTSGHNYNVTHMNFYNNHASQSTPFRVESNDGTVTAVLWNGTLLAGEMLVFTETGLWLHYDVNGGLYPSVGPTATQSDMESGTSNTVYVTPLAFNWHPGAAKFWCKAGVAGTASVSWNLTSIGDTGTGVMTPTIATDFSSANWCAQVTIENLDASIDATTDKQTCMIGLAGQAAGTLQCICGNETGTAAADPTQWHVVGYGDQ